MSTTQKKEMIRFKADQAIRQKKEIQDIQNKSRMALIPYMYKCKADFQNLMHKNTIERVNLIYGLKLKLNKK